MNHELGVITHGEVQLMVGLVSRKKDPFLSACAVIAGMIALLREYSDGAEAVLWLRAIAEQIEEEQQQPDDDRHKPANDRKTPRNH